MNPRNFGMVVCSRCKNSDHHGIHRPNRRRNTYPHSNTYGASVRPSPNPSPDPLTARGYYDNVGVAAAAAKRQQPSPSCVDGLMLFEFGELGPDDRKFGGQIALLPALETANDHDA